MQTDDDKYTDEETARRRDEVVRRMANTPPQPKIKSPRRSGKKKKAAVGRAARKGRAAGRVVVRRMGVTFEKRDWGSGRLTWREQPDHHRRIGPCVYALRRISNRQAKRRELAGDVLQMYGKRG